MMQNKITQGHLPKGLGFILLGFLLKPAKYLAVELLLVPVRLQWHQRAGAPGTKVLECCSLPETITRHIPAAGSSCSGVSFWFRAGTHLRVGCQGVSSTKHRRRRHELGRTKQRTRIRPSSFAGVSKKTGTSGPLMGLQAKDKVQTGRRFQWGSDERPRRKEHCWDVSFYAAAVQLCAGVRCNNDADRSARQSL